LEVAAERPVDLLICDSHVRPPFPFAAFLSFQCENGLQQLVGDHDEPRRGLKCPLIL